MGKPKTIGWPERFAIFIGTFAGLCVVEQFAGREFTNGLATGLLVMCLVSFWESSKDEAA